MAITIKDVAHRAGVSTATVSHVVNQTRFVSDGVKLRVVDAIDTLGYVMNSNARGLRSSVSHRIGLLVPEVSDYFPIDIIEPIESVLNRAGYQLILGYTHDSIKMEQRQLEFFNYQQIDGLLLFPAYGDHSYIFSMDIQYPIVLLDRQADNFPTDCVLGDDENAVFFAVSKLIASGYRSIGILIGAKENSNSHSRYAGYVRALRSHGLKLDPGLVKIDVVSHSAAHAKTQELLNYGGMDALYATNIVLTIGALKCLRKNGVVVPRDMGMLGWGDSKWTELTDPPLSVMHHPNQEMGRKAAKILLRRIDNPDGPFREYRLPVRMIERESF